MTQTDTAISARAHTVQPSAYRAWIATWPPAVIAGGVMVTAAWIMLLGFAIASILWDLI
jgi:hypothetical protein